MRVDVFFLFVFLGGFLGFFVVVSFLLFFLYLFCCSSDFIVWLRFFDICSLRKLKNIKKRYNGL